VAALSTLARSLTNMVEGYRKRLMMSASYKVMLQDLITSNL